MLQSDIGVIAFAFAVLVQFGALAWGASKISTAVDGLKEAITKLTKTVDHLDHRVQDHEVRVTVLERTAKDGR